MSSNVRKFKKVKTMKLNQLKQNQLKKRTFSKMQWGVRAFSQWRIERLSNVVNFDVKIYEADLERVELLTKENLVYALCMFIPEVVKMDGTDYPGKTLYEMVTCIQKHLHQQKKFWKLLDDREFSEVRTVLDNVMKERAKANIGVVKKQAGYISLEIEKSLWEKNVLGEDTPDKLRDTVLFLLGINLGLREGDEHYDLRRETKQKPSQISFERAPNGQRCLVYREDTVTKTNDGGLGSIKKERKVVWVYPSEDINKCLVRLVDKYMSLLPEVGPKTKKPNFYLRSLEKINPAQWYGEQVVGRHTLTQVVGRLMKNCDLSYFVSNHSLRRTGATRLLQGGVDRKTVKEFTGHTSDAIDKYQVTSHNERAQISKILNGEVAHKTTEPCLEMSVKDVGNDKVKTCECNCKKQTLKLSETGQLGSVIQGLMDSRKGSKTVIKLEIEFSD